jgi:hypothetical protein
MRRLALAPLPILAVLALALAPGARGDASEYGIESASASVTSNQAGAHADFTLDVRLNKDPKGQLPSTTKDIFFELPPGLLGNPSAIPKCSAAQLFGADVSSPSNGTGCSQDAQVGVTEIQVFDQLGNLSTFLEPVYNMQPRAGEPARLGFLATSLPVLIDTELRSDGDYGVTGMVEGASSLKPLLAAKTVIWGSPADPSHDAQRITPYEGFLKGGVPQLPGGKRPSNLVPVAFFSNPTRCGVAQGVGITAIPYQLPDLQAQAFAPMTPNTGCGVLDFKPEFSVAPSTDRAETGTGLGVKLSFPTAGLKAPDLYTEATQRRVEVTLPEGITANPSQAAGGLGVCSEADLARETPTSAPGAGCPESSKIGSAVAKSPALEELVEGSLYLAKPYQNPFGSLLALYMVFKVPERGVIVKLSARVEPDPRTGQLVTTVDDIPQLPVSSFELHFREGTRAPLVTPPGCGIYETTAKFSSWAGQTSTLHPSFEIRHGVEGGPCPSGLPPFRPGFSAGGLSDTAGAYTPFNLRLTRQDGDQDLTKFSTTLPPGAVAKLAGVERCPDATIEAAKTKTGKEEQTAPSCPAGSEIGHVLGGAGVGQVLTYAAGNLYLAGPYNGAQLSVVAIVPAVAGPFDVGTIVTRQALSLDPDTGRGVVDGSRSDPLPHILAGIPLKVRDIRAYVDRPDFTLNPTNCDPLAFDAELWGGGIDPFSTADDSPVSLSTRFQVANCALLGYKPRLELTLRGGTHRGAHPALRAVFRPRKGDANSRAIQVTLPRSAFIEQSHFRTICTRVQFAAERCPKGSVYGHVRAFTPLLDEPLQGPVYLRSSNHKLPDLVFALRGIVDINVVGKVDSVDGRLRGTFASIPDAPLTKAVLTMQGGKKGLFVNSTDLCRAEQRAEAHLTAQNAKRHNFNPVVAAGCGGKAKARQHPRHRTR